MIFEDPRPDLSGTGPAELRNQNSAPKITFFFSFCNLNHMRIDINQKSGFNGQADQRRYSNRPVSRGFVPAGLPDVKWQFGTFECVIGLLTDDY